MQYNEYLISTVDADGLWFSTRASVATVLSMHSYISSCLWVNLAMITTWKNARLTLVYFTKHKSRFAFSVISQHWNGSRSWRASSWKITFLRSSSVVVFRGMVQDFTCDKSTLVQVMAWCLMAPSHYLNQCWLRLCSSGIVSTMLYVVGHQLCFSRTY